MTLLVGIYSVAVSAAPVTLVLCAAASLIVAGVFARGAAEFGWGGLIATVLVLGVAAALGWSSRRRLEMAQRIADQDAELRRLAIARDVHDVVAHSLGTIAVQAAVGSRLAASDPDAARRALDDIAARARASLSDVRGILAQVRDPGVVPTAPGLGDLDRLVAEARLLDVTLILDVDDTQVPAPVGQAAYRLVQESLSNVRRHTQADRAEVRVVAGAALDVRIVNPIEVPMGHLHEGNGLRGMRERAAELGGSLRAGAQGAEFVVSASLPVGGRS